MAEQWHPVEDAELRNLLQSEGLLLVRVAGRHVCLGKQGEQVWAFSPKCPHEGGPLASGQLNERQEVVCPWHRFAFSLDTGACSQGGYFLKTYEVKREGYQLWVKLPRKKFLGLF